MAKLNAFAQTITRADQRAIIEEELLAAGQRIQERGGIPGNVRVQAIVSLVLNAIMGYLLLRGGIGR